VETRGRALGLVGAGALLAVVLALLRDGIAGACGEESRVRPVAVWAADRDAGTVYGLDDDLIVVRQVRLQHPLAVSARPDGGAWVLASSDGAPAGACILVRISSEGEIQSQSSVGRVGTERMTRHRLESDLLAEERILIASPGAILRCGREGRIESGQGGFSYLVDLDPVPRASE
jgi:hypothetical protein